MRKNECLPPRERAELRLYTILGVQQFRKMVFLLEKVVHFRDKKTNTNYHVGGFTPEAVKNFEKYLFYNGSIHVRNIIYALIYSVLRVVFGSRMFWFDFVVIVHTIKDIYCVMLQRYNYLQIKGFETAQANKRRARVERKTREMQENFSKKYQSSNCERDLQLLREMKRKLANHEPVIVDDEMMMTLLQLENAMDPS